MFVQIIIILNFILEVLDLYIYMMMPFFNRNWAGACSGCWVGPGLILGWSAGHASSGLG